MHRRAVVERDLLDALFRTEEPDVQARLLARVVLSAFDNYYAVSRRIPALAKAASGVVDALRENGKLEKRIYELIVLMVSRHWSAQYAWAVHEPLGRAAGRRNERRRKFQQDL